MILLTEFQDAQVESRGRKTFITGKFLAGNVVNKNGRLYPTEVLHEAVEARRSDIKNGGLLGLLGHPEDPVGDPSKISHVITELTRKGDDFYGKARLVNEGCGKIARSIIECGGAMGVSSRGSGDIKKQNGINTV